MIEIVSYLVAHPNIPIDIAVLVGILYLLNKFSSIASHHYERDEMIQNKHQELLRDILEELRRRG